MNLLFKKLFNFFSSCPILKIFIIFTLCININCFDSNHSDSEKDDVSIEISPSAPLVTPGDDLQFTATFHNPDGSTEDVTSEATWAATNTAVAIISNSPGSEGLATAIAAGATKITAEFGNISDTTNLTVTKPDWWELEVTTTSSSQNMTIQMDGPVNLTVDWGDGIEEATSLTSLTHTYASAGVYTLRIGGQASRIHFDNPDAQARLTGILSVVQAISGLTSFENTFNNCSNLTGSIHAGLFDNAPLVTSFQSTFANCSGLTGSIPSGLFDNNTQVTTFSSTFYGCSGLTGSIPSGLFDNNPLVTTFYCTFAYSPGFTGSIPSGLFDNNPLVTIFTGTFAAGSSSGLTGSIPSGLFDNNTQVTSFYGTFVSCSGLTDSIPSGLFDNNTLVTSFESTFSYCSSLTSIPSGLFDNNALVTNFRDTFNECTGVTSAVPTLWISHPGATTHGRCFYNVINASNYASIPADWKNP